MPTNKYKLSDGVIRQNIVLMSGTALAPVAACAVNYQNAMALAAGFTVITFLSVTLCRFIPANIAYTIRITLYALIAGLAYVPTYFAVRYLFGAETVETLGVYLPILAVNPIILTKVETRFRLRPLNLMWVELAGYIAGFNLACVAVGTVRDILVNKHIGNYEVSFGFDVPALSTVFGGLIFLGIAAGFFRYLYNQHKAREAKKAEKERERQELVKQL